MESAGASGGEMVRNMAAVNQLAVDVAIGPPRTLPLLRSGGGDSLPYRSVRPHGRKYNSYTPEMRTHIAKYAMKAGDLEAAQHFSRELGHKVAVTSAWRFRKAYMRELKRLHQDGGGVANLATSTPHFGERRRLGSRRNTKTRCMTIETAMLPAGQEDDQMDAGLDCDWTPPTEAEMKVLQAKKERSDKISKLMGDYLLKGYRMLATSCAVCGTILLRDKQQKDYCVACSELDTEHAKDDPALSAEAARSQVREQELIGSSLLSTSHDDLSTQHLGHPGRETPPTQALPSSSNVSPAASDGFRHQMAHGGRGISGLSISSNTPTPPPAPANPQATVLPQTAGMPTILAQQQPMDAGGRATVCGSRNNSRVGRVVERSLDSVLDKMDWASEELKRNGSLETAMQLCRLIQACADAAESLKGVVNT